MGHYASEMGYGEKVKTKEIEKMTSRLMLLEILYEELRNYGHALQDSIQCPNYEYYSKHSAGVTDLFRIYHILSNNSINTQQAIQEIMNNKSGIMDNILLKYFSELDRLLNKE